MIDTLMVGMRIGVVVAFTSACNFPALPTVSSDASGDRADGGSGSGSGSGSEANVAITSGPAANATTGPRVSFSFTVHDGSPFCRFDNAPLAPCTSPIAVNIAAGVHTFYVQAQNSLGTIDSDTRLWNVACTQRQPSDDTFALYRMEEGSGTTVANAHPRAGTMINTDLRFDNPNAPTWTSAGRFGGALHFTAYGVNNTDHVLANVLDGMSFFDVGAHSIEMWVKPTFSFAHDLQLFQAGGGGTTANYDYSLFFRKSGTQGRFALTVGNAGNVTTVTSQLVSIGDWHFVALVFSPPSPATLFVDGQVAHTVVPITGTVAMFNVSLFDVYEGDLDEIHMTFHPSTDQELLDLYCPL